jgi:hypothetical protein
VHQRIKSPILSLITLPDLVLSNAGTCRYLLPFCAVAYIRGELRIPRAAGAYRDIQANMERTSMRKGLDHHGRGCRDHSVKVLKPAAEYMLAAPESSESGRHDS